MKKTALISLIICSISCYADSLLDDYYQTSSTNTQSSQSKLDQPYATSRIFANLNQVTQSLQSFGIKAQILNQQENQPSNVLINTNGTYKDFVNKSATSFGYTWKLLQDNTVVFSAINPVKPKPAPQPKPIVTTSTGSSAAADKQIIITNNWTYTPNDKYISNTLARWANQAGYQMVWRATDDFEVQSSGALTGGFKVAVNEVLKSFKNSEHPLQAQWYKNNVVVITNFGK